MTLTKKLMLGIVQSAQMENMMTAAERVLEYGKLRTEAPLHPSLTSNSSKKRRRRPPKGW